MYKQDLTLNNLLGLICDKTLPPNQLETIQNLYLWGKFWKKFCLSFFLIPLI